MSENRQRPRFLSQYKIRLPTYLLSYLLLAVVGAAAATATTTTALARD